MKTKLLLIGIICLFTIIACQNITLVASVNLPSSNEQFINKIIGEGVTVSNLKLIGEDGQNGIFGGAESILEFDSGIVISTGDVSKIFSSSNTQLSKEYGTQGDEDLGDLVTGKTNDAAVIEFDTIPTSNKLSFKYVFASEEFDQSEEYNDVFALYIDGTNIAYLPNSTTTVTIQSVRNSTGNYIDNTNGTQFAFLGYTKVFNCEADVTPGQTVHIKIAIADIVDSSYDSAVFIKENSLRYTAADAPIIRNVKESYDIGEKIKIKMEKSGTIYVVPKGNYQYSTDITNLANKLSYSYQEGEEQIIDTSTLPAGEYVIYLVDTDEVLSKPSNAIVITPVHYIITNNIETNANGSISSVSTSTAGENIHVKTTPNENYKLKELYYVLPDNTCVEITNNSFIMPASNIKLKATFELIYEEKTITEKEKETTVSMKGELSGNPRLVIIKTDKENEGYNSLITLLKDDKIMIGSYDVSIIGGTYTGKLILTFTVGKQYEGDSITIYHKLSNGEIEIKTAVVKDGKVTIEVDELSPFMLVADKEILYTETKTAVVKDEKITMEKKDRTPKTGDSINSHTVLSILSLIGVVTTACYKKK